MNVPIGTVAIVIKLLENLLVLLMKSNTIKIDNQVFFYRQSGTSYTVQSYQKSLQWFLLVLTIWVSDDNSFKTRSGEPSYLGEIRFMEEGFNFKY